MAGRQSTPQRTPFWFSSSKMKFLFIIHKPENLCNSSGKAVSFIRVPFAVTCHFPELLHGYCGRLSLGLPVMGRDKAHGW